jgi:hypothetical protein
MSNSVISGDWVYDLETYPNIFTFCLVRADGKNWRVFEVSDRKNEVEQILTCLRWMRDNNQRLVGFNNLGFDYPILHTLMLDSAKAKAQGEELKVNAKYFYRLAQKQIESFKGDGFGHTIKVDEILVKQVDLYKTNHFDNKARSTSLKMLEFNMRSNNIEDLPFPVGTLLKFTEMDVLIKYNRHDVKMTLDFYMFNVEALLFRADLSKKYSMDFTNHNDTKIGKDYFITRLETEIPGSCYKTVDGKRKINQTKRPFINIKECLFDYYDFKRPEFIAVQQWLSKQVITETKGVFSEITEHDLGDVAKYAEMHIRKKKFKTKPSPEDMLEFNEAFPLGWVEAVDLKATEYLMDSEGNHVMTPVLDEFGNIDPSKKPKKARTAKQSYFGCYRVAEVLNVVVDGFRLDFGTGGLHGSVSSSIIKATDDLVLIDADVSSMYPNIAISNRVYPKHLTEKFCDIYADVYEQRKGFAKGTPENAVMKLALNGTYGETANQFSPLFDPMFTMSITINGQLSLCLLAEKLLEIDSLTLIQANTDGLTCLFPKASKDKYLSICDSWQKQVNLELEYANYSTMYIRDVNNYIAVYTDGKTKRKGAYQYEGLGWHQNQSALVIQKAVEAYLIRGIPLASFIKYHEDKWDFMLRTKVPRSSRLIMVMDDGTEVPQQNICRYYPCNSGGKLVKIMPPLEGDVEERRLSIDKEWSVQTCNDMDDFKDDINYQYYIQEAQKLIM